MFPLILVLGFLLVNLPVINAQDGPGWEVGIPGITKSLLAISGEFRARVSHQLLVGELCEGHFGWAVRLFQQANQVFDILGRPGYEIVHTHNIMTFGNEPVSKMRTQETGPGKG